MWWPNLGCQPVLVSLSLVPARFTLILNSFFKGERSPHVMAPDLDPRRERLPPTKPEKRESPALFQMSVATDRKGWCVKCVQETTTTQQKEEKLLKKRHTNWMIQPAGLGFEIDWKCWMALHIFYGRFTTDRVILIGVGLFLPATCHNSLRNEGLDRNDWVTTR